MRSLFIIALSLCFTGCFNPRPATYLCDQSNACPPGLYCVSGLCAAMPSADAGPIDLTNPSQSSGCKNGSETQVGIAFACPGAYSPAAPASSLCAASWEPCQNAAGINLTKCDSLGAFFASGYLGKAYQVEDFVCTGSDASYPQRDVYGCGQRTGTMDLLVCNGFLDYLIPGDAFWSSPNLATSLDDTTDTSTTDGVLCCPSTPQG
jgi:hypothetical protein